MICYGFKWFGLPTILKKWSRHTLLDKTPTCDKQASISFLVNHGLQMLTSSVLMTLFQSLDHIWDPKYLNPIILAFFGSLRLSQPNGPFLGILLLKLK